MRSKLAFLLLLLTVSLRAQVATTVTIEPPRATDDWLRLRSSESANSLLTLQSTTNLQTWSTVATTHDKFFNFPTRPEVPGALIYRVRSEKRSATNDWKNELLFPEEPLRSAEGQDLRWVKFLILLNDPTRVYFQDSAKFPFHYDYARQRLAPFDNLDRAAFDAISLHRTNQQVVLGSILYPPTPNYVEYGVQFVGLDGYTPDEISRWFELVKASVYATNGAAAYYFPVFEQSEVARTNAAAFAAKNIPVASIERWINQNHVYSAGWALGSLKYFPAAEITAAYTDGRLKPQDILLTDGVPAETPIVAGIISLTPSTPNSHTAILSQSFGIPFVYLPDAADQSRLQSLVGRKIVLRAITTWAGATIKIIDVEVSLPAQVETDLLALKKPAPINYSPKQSFGSISANTDNLSPADIRYFGGKAANFGILRDSVPTNSPQAIAYSFDLWDAFMDQPTTGGGTLRQRIAQMLASHTNYPPDIPSLKSTLAAIRTIIRNEATFTDAQKQPITNALSIFAPNRNIRFRSSTNVEDSENFTGAGLYDSYSGCLLDDLDNDTTGPCRCDPTEPNERGVFRALQRVYASFYNDNAFLERLRHSVKENEVAMGVLVHHSFPDAVELANGVATIQFNLKYSTNLNGNVVSQVGAESVTNPDGSSTPEVVRLERFSGFNNLTLTRRSSRLPLGAYVMTWEDDYIGFGKLFEAIGLRYKQLSLKDDFLLDFEFKKDVNLGLVVKQVREIPQDTSNTRTTAFLINEPTTWCVFQGEHSDIFSLHRLKSIWSLNTANLRLAKTNLTQGLYRESSVSYISNTVIHTLTGQMTNWPNGSASSDGMTNFWNVDTRAWRLETLFRDTAFGPEPPIFTQQDFQLMVRVTYNRALPKIEFDNIAGTTEDNVTLRPCPQRGPGDILRQLIFTTKSGAKIETAYYWPKEPTGAVAGYTAPLVEFVQTKITGLTPNPITLSNYYSQTYHPYHHNFSEEFMFEPRLDPNVSAADIAALEAANIRLIYVLRSIDGADKITAMSPAETFRDL